MLNQNHSELRAYKFLNHILIFIIIFGFWYILCTFGILKFSFENRLNYYDTSTKTSTFWDSEFLVTVHWFYLVSSLIQC